MGAAVVGIAGNPSRPSKTRTLVNAIVETVASRTGRAGKCFDIADAQPELGVALYRENTAGPLCDILTAIETCGFLVVGSPTYKASYTGLLKHLFDLVDMKALTGRPVIVCATGRAAAHGPKVEQHFRMLFEFFDAKVVPGFIFALDEDFTEDGRPKDALLHRIRDQIADAGLIHA